MGEEVGGRGCYVLLLELRAEAEVAVGSLGRLKFRPGCYAYVGSAMGRGDALRRRLGRHFEMASGAARPRRWHIDYLTSSGRFELVKALAVPSSDRAECRISKALLEAGGEPVRRFGSSDCSEGCPSHLYRFPSAEAAERALRAAGFEFAEVTSP